MELRPRKFRRGLFRSSLWTRFMWINTKDLNSSFIQETPKLDSSKVIAPNIRKNNNDYFIINEVMLNSYCSCVLCLEQYYTKVSLYV
jgi:hypothetical protein